MTVSQEITSIRSGNDGSLEEASAAPLPRAPEDGVRLVLPARTGDGRSPASQWVRRSVDALRRALDDGSLHHHRRAGVPDGRRSPNVEVVRAWAAGLDVEAQCRVCPACADEGAAASD
jgi:hypothetical protein